MFCGVSKFDLSSAYFFSKWVVQRISTPSRLEFKITNRDFNLCCFNYFFTSLFLSIALQPPCWAPLFCLHPNEYM